MASVRWTVGAKEDLREIVAFISKDSETYAATIAGRRELTEELFNLRFQLSMGVAKNPARAHLARRDLARAKAVLRQRTAAG